MALEPARWAPVPALRHPGTPARGAVDFFCATDEARDRAKQLLPFTTLRRGSPYTLVLTKQAALFERDAALRAQQKVLLGWLKEQRSAFSEIDPSGSRRRSSSMR
ncbi:hypothetical protein WMF31_27180 [Sorangium sp. So ce1036]|uniref:hypothetical protein n=1 Tax=Sorangium sp. So ce1036 TaxID=3133328 RepID=UPI003F0CB5B3